MHPSPPKKPLHQFAAIGIVLTMVIVLAQIAVFAFGCLFDALVERHIKQHMMWLMGLPSFMTEVLLCLVAGLAMGTVMLMPTWIFVARWRKAHDRYQRWKTNHCIACGYDLRAHKPGDKCPECGTLIPEQSQTELRA